MTYICWKRYSDSDGKDIISLVEKNLPPDAIRWEDQVTRTRFFLSGEDYKGYLKQISAETEKKNIHELVAYFEGKGFQSCLPYYTGSKNRTLVFRDVARLFVLFAYLFAIENKEEFDKNELRKSAYCVFIKQDSNAFTEAWDAIRCLMSKEENTKFNCRINVKLLKGSAYKIKKYFLENDEIKDIRGASTLLTYVGEHLIPSEIKKKFIDECIIYAGGGNVLSVLPSCTVDLLPYDLEQIFTEYTLTVQSAFSMIEVSLEGLLRRYGKVMGSLENTLKERSRLKLYNTTTPISTMLGKEIEIDNQKVSIGAEYEDVDSSICKFCGVRIAKYTLTTENQEAICGSCLHKRLVGKKIKQVYMKKFEKYTGEKIEKLPDSIDDLGDDGGNVAIIYGDGNNMGGVIQNINNIADLMYFSRKTSIAAQKATYEAIKSNYPNKLFEIIAVGGDDIFLIVPAENSIAFATKLIELFNREFRNLSVEDSDLNRSKYTSTLSVGVSIGKIKTPVRLMFQYAEDAMAVAKKKAKKYREKHEDEGTLDFVILDRMDEDFTELRKKPQTNGVRATLLPYSPKRANTMLNLVRQMKQGQNKVHITNLYQLKQKSDISTVLEGSLFYCYDQAKHKNRLEKVICVHQLDGVEWKKGYYVEKVLEEVHFYSPWRDLLDLWNFSGGEADGIDQTPKI